ncbi:hypothetical protein LTR05_007088 [Lithohypha guttulata]|uniref:Heterokaryon incompatibility domain-containing protein n=1 Tax=Lithohypha guttulata TaxID=1690604 RepID=A0AAN7SWA5_9EURO|nr:hypothetical protein LTR05_007088 [Lithohypha guttulata]
MTTRSKRAELRSTETSETSYHDVYIAVMGCTGSGKSSFIELCTGQDAGVGHGLESCTTDVQEYSFVYESRYLIHLVDTPGFDDTHRSDADVLRDIACWMGTVYMQEARLAGIIYLHPITDNRMRGSARRNLRMFKKLCGEECFPKIVLASTFWSSIDVVTGQRYERELIDTESFWGYMTQRGSSVMRHTDCKDQKSAFAILQYILSQSLEKQDIPLAIQREMVDQSKSINDTAAGQSVDEELRQQRQRFEREIQIMIREKEEALMKRDLEGAREAETTRLEYEEKLKKSRQASEELRTSLSDMQAQLAQRLRDLEEEVEKKRAEIEGMQKQSQHFQDELKIEAETTTLHARTEELTRHKKGIFGKISGYYTQGSAWLDANPNAVRHMKTAAKVAAIFTATFAKSPNTSKVANALLSSTGHSEGAKVSFDRTQTSQPSSFRDSVGDSIEDDQARQPSMSSSRLNRRSSTSEALLYQEMKGTQMRLLRLRNNGSEKITESADIGDLIIVDLNSGTLPQYTALSYTWGKEDRPNRMIVSGNTIMLTNNLFDILQTIQSARTRSNSGGLCDLVQKPLMNYIWIDAICINQDDKNEKKSQVDLMASIFGQASLTLVWWGPAAHNSDLAMDWLTSTANIPQAYFEQISDSEMLSRVYDRSAWEALCGVLMRPYFRRRWIIEEVVLSKHALIVCGYRTLEWETFILGWDRTFGTLANILFHHKMLTTTADVETIGAINIFQFRRKRGMEISLFEALTRNRRCNTLKHRDRVFAFRAMCSNKEAERLRALDYTTDIKHIFTQQTLCHLELWDNLDILCVCHHMVRRVPPKVMFEKDGMLSFPDNPIHAQAEPLAKLPTWVPNWTSPRTMWRLGPASMAGDSKWQPVFNAAAGTVPNIMNLDDAERSGSLHVTGTRVDSVHSVSTLTPMWHPKQRDPCDDFWLECWELCRRIPLQLTPFTTESDRLDAFWRTITLGGRRVGTNHLFTIEFIRYFCYDFFLRSQKKSPLVQQLERYGFGPVPIPPQSKWFEEKDVPKLFFSITQPPIIFDGLPEFRFFVTASGRMGMGPSEIRVGDDLYVLRGCSSPLVLRRAANHSTGSQIQGEAYIHGFMFGEAFELVGHGVLEEQVVVLV